VQTFTLKVSCKHCLAPQIQRQLESMKALLLIAGNFVSDTGKSSCQREHKQLVQREAVIDK